MTSYETPQFTSQCCGRQQGLLMYSGMLQLGSVTIHRKAPLRNYVYQYITYRQDWVSGTSYNYRKTDNNIGFCMSVYIYSMYTFTTTSWVNSIQSSYNTSPVLFSKTLETHVTQAARTLFRICPITMCTWIRIKICSDHQNELLSICMICVSVHPGDKQTIFILVQRGVLDLVQHVCTYALPKTKQICLSAKFLLLS